MLDGKPKVEWEPKVNRWTGAEIQAVLKGAESLDGPWEDVPEGSGSPGRLAPPLTPHHAVLQGCGGAVGGYGPLGTPQLPQE